MKDMGPVGDAVYGILWIRNETFKGEIELLVSCCEFAAKIGA